MNRARVYKRGPRLYLHAVSLTTGGRPVMSAPIAFLAFDDAETFVGETLLSALAASRTGARDPGEAIKRQILDAARSKTWTKFMRGTSVCDVEKDELGTRLFPARNATRRALLPQEKPTTTLAPAVVAIELGWAVKAALRNLEPRRRAPRRSNAA